MPHLLKDLFSDRQYRLECDFKASDQGRILYERDFKFHSLLSESVGITRTENQSFNESSGKITARFDPGNFDERNEEWAISGPQINVKCRLFDINRFYLDREFGIIQTSNIYFESVYDDGNFFVGFRPNVLLNQHEVIDTTNEIYIPFYSEHSFVKIPANENVTDKLLELTDRPRCEIQLKCDFGSLQKLRRYQQFHNYIVMRYKYPYDKIWKLFVLHSFDWFIYWDVVRTNIECRQIFSGINDHIVPRDFPLSEDQCQYTCNDDQFDYYYIDRDNKFVINNYPKSLLRKYKSAIPENLDEEKLCDDNETNNSIDDDSSEDDDSVKSIKLEFAKNVEGVLRNKFNI